MQKNHLEVLKKMYSAFAENQYQVFVDACAPQFTFQVAGKSALAGKWTQENFISGYAQKLQDLSKQNFKLEVHDILASDLHATVLASMKLMQGGKLLELRTVHVWRFDQGKPVAGYEYPRDLYQFDAAWAGSAL